MNLMIAGFVDIKEEQLDGKFKVTTCFSRALCTVSPSF